jgi:hypothetical protein
VAAFGGGGIAGYCRPVRASPAIVPERVGCQRAPL